MKSKVLRVMTRDDNRRMPSFERRTFIAAPRSAVWAFFLDAHNLARITPPFLHFRIIDAPDRDLRGGDRIRYSIRVAGIRMGWTTLLTDWTDGVAFTDVQERGPYRRWSHRHVLEDADGGTMMIDRVEYELPLGMIGCFFGGWFVRRNLDAIFEYRERTMRVHFA
jgi:ligand-binding SRPBCC domain-containing protein